jgi:hypothetical protein
MFKFVGGNIQTQKHRQQGDYISLLLYVQNKEKRDKNGRLCGLVVRVLGYRSGGPGSIPGTTRKKK